MPTIILIVCLGLLIWVEPASAIDYPLKVKVHEDLQLQPDDYGRDADSILRRASRLLTRHCGNTINLKRNGKITTFKSVPSTIGTPADRDAVHRVPAEVKVVKTIDYCVEAPQPGKPPVLGCSFREDRHPRKTISMIVVRDHPNPDANPNLWAHELGHNTGLHHRDDPDPLKRPLMTPCDIQTVNQVVTKDECSCFLAGPGNGLKACTMPDPFLICRDPPH